MIRSICRSLKPIHHQLNQHNLTTLSMRNATLLFEMRSGRVGKIKLESQKEFDKILERTGSMGLVAEDAPDGEEEVSVVTKVEDINKSVVYQLVYAADEAEGYDNEMYDGEMDEAEEQQLEK
eukprot:CAMPEP_0197022608 /NCGR_PEP_ID=MMETSP1384-20130603/3438_1 /TAXON_ID=29189 /ORGANISM="Ammonia sp." /LENGTH=121 /DNA_ID=CAMNT_0042450677 /DNA_START=104 /DNA_END=469 /DNA_ORIENTATION=-